jgi:hypothetical protein
MSAHVADLAVFREFRLLICPIGLEPNRDRTNLKIKLVIGQFLRAENLSRRWGVGSGENSADHADPIDG